MSARYRLRHEFTDHELEEGRFTIGRRTDCHLVLEDALISRVHAVIEVQEGGVWIEDNGSRNGMRINGAPVLQRTRLSHFDHIVLGTQSLTLLEAGRSSAPPGNTYCRKCGQGIELDDLFCSRCGAPALSTAQSRTDQARIFTEEDQETEETETGATFALVDRLASRSIATKQFEAAERMLERVMMAQLQAAMKGASIPPNQLSRATQHALTLANALQAHRWLDWLFQIYTEVGTLIEPEHIDPLFEVVHSVNYSEPRPIERYLEMVEQSNLAENAAAKFVVQRLQSLQKVIRA